MSTREVVTFQVGHYANFVGTHWWNLQEASFVYSPAEAIAPKELNHDVMFREGQTLAGDITYTPRLIALDLKGSLNSLKEDGTLYDLQEQSDDVLWNCDVTLHKAPSIPKNDFLLEMEQEEDFSQDRLPTDTEKSEGDQDATCDAAPVFGKKFYNLDDKVEVWSDFLRMHLHPRSLQIIREFQHQDEQRSFDIFGMGEQLLSNKPLQEELEDKIHFFFEECDNLQGIHMLVDSNDAFGGVGSSLLEQLQEDYGNKTIMLFAVQPSDGSPPTARGSLHRLLNTAISYERYCQHSSCVLPLTLNSHLGRKTGTPTKFPYLGYQAGLPYHSSGILAAGLESMSVPYRMCSQGALMSHMVDALTPQGRKVLGLQLALPFCLRQQESLLSGLKELADDSPWWPLFPMMSPSVTPYSQSVVLRGIEPGRINSRPHQAGPSHLRGCDSMQELLNTFLTDLYPHTQNASFTVQSACQVKTPFPHIFLPQIDKYGCIAEYSRASDEGVNSVPTLCSLQSTPCSGQLLHALHSEVKKVNIRKHHAYLQLGMEEDDFEEMKCSLLSLAECYELPSHMLDSS